jgi:hypothetical protein
MRKRKKRFFRTIRTVLAGFDEIEVGYVFGTFCKGDFGDVDVAILVTSDPTPYQAMRFARGSSGNLSEGSATVLRPM